MPVSKTAMTIGFLLSNLTLRFLLPLKIEEASLEFNHHEFAICPGIDVTLADTKDVVKNAIQNEALES
tara:strand:- start:67825 stop:68028 length:204 start_codon:yes stop_codon:yes gene_type:complete